MKKAIKGKTPTLISGSSGKPKIATVGKKSYCGRCNGVFLKGQICFEIPKAGAGFTSARRFCLSCFRKVLEQTKKDVASIEKALVSAENQFNRNTE